MEIRLVVVDLLFEYSTPNVRYTCVLSYRCALVHIDSSYELFEPDDLNRDHNNTQCLFCNKKNPTIVAYLTELRSI